MSQSKSVISRVPEMESRRTVKQSSSSNCERESSDLHNKLYSIFWHRWQSDPLARRPAPSSPEGHLPDWRAQFTYEQVWTFQNLPETSNLRTLVHLPITRTFTRFTSLPSHGTLTFRSSAILTFFSVRPSELSGKFVTNYQSTPS